MSMDNAGYVDTNQTLGIVVPSGAPTGAGGAALKTDLLNLMAAANARPEVLSRGRQIITAGAGGGFIDRNFHFPAARLDPADQLVLEMTCAFNGDAGANATILGSTGAPYGGGGAGGGAPDLDGMLNMNLAGNDHVWITAIIDKRVDSDAPGAPAGGMAIRLRFSGPDGLISIPGGGLFLPGSIEVDADWYLNWGIGRGAAGDLGLSWTLTRYRG